MPFPKALFKLGLIASASVKRTELSFLSAPRHSSWAKIRARSDCSPTMIREDAKIEVVVESATFAQEFWAENHLISPKPPAYVAHEAKT